ncbi:MaoC/PaaZ C-terminal domain-containing protein [Mycobacterium xenopi]|uniref:Dehydratase n=1 Tax=Mycobacterium xenopi TaxID=1789 RepID=A0AAD1H4V9_MYCXE|nr:MaoC/PaaZ C-terminal domain-containing protein [Mycobacterium xenopi]MDA3642258.1 MaoC/PaaZ C-terminal domain-containing protein [Mycobacterium xenopi]MDA3657814.1 MaoC/PaaZ C-terminal domain-containing protein [Mycobacterium xenopi]MDA3663262.1 MaoC/PaaZ C-terminal domain-containing protein [Mycobacterium xenopi]ORX19278.1 dehydratase [Mycobacterium xenopi]SPX90258.1 dehydratase [Mycobacterium xenopi]
MTADDGFNLSRLGTWTDEREFKVDAERTIAYAEATNDRISAHLDGSLAPPVFAVVPVFQIMGEATMSVVPGNLMTKVLHGEHDFRLYRPIEPGEVLTVRAKPIGISGKDSGVVVTTLAETRGYRGDLVNEQYFVGFFRGGVFDGTVGVPSPGHTFDESLRNRDPDLTAVQRFDEDQTFRYSGPAGDPMPIHLDDGFAKSVGLPGIIIHGLCTVAFISHALITNISPDDPARLKRLAVRFSKPARPQETITTRIWRTGRETYAFETAGDEHPDKSVITDGLAGFAP